jgi:site-specific DNA-adenine methylase
MRNLLWWTMNLIANQFSRRIGGPTLDFVYFDPSYRDCKVGSYRSDDIKHEELVEELLGAPYRWLLSEYEHPIYSRLGPPFWRKEVQLRTTNFRDDGGKGRRVECLWRNYYQDKTEGHGAY